MIDRISAHLRVLVGERHPHTSRESLLAAERYIAQTFAELGYAVEPHSFDALGGTYRNLLVSGGLAARPGEPALLVGAHYDTVIGSPGADDNASAVAVLLECARALRQVSLQRPVRFVAFCLEEEDLLGSRAYVTALRQRGEGLAGAIILECVGYACSEAGTQQAPPHVPVAVPSVGNFLAVVGNQASASLVSLLTAAGHRAVPDLPLVPLIVPGCGEQLPDTRRSDHAAFWDESYPAVMLTDTANFRNPNYHQPTDTLETLDVEFIARVARLVTEAVRHWAESDRHDA